MNDNNLETRMREGRRKENIYIYTIIVAISLATFWKIYEIHSEVRFSPRISGMEYTGFQEQINHYFPIPLEETYNKK